MQLEYTYSGSNKIQSKAQERSRVLHLDLEVIKIGFHQEVVSICVNLFIVYSFLQEHGP